MKWGGLEVTTLFRAGKATKSSHKMSNTTLQGQDVLLPIRKLIAYIIAARYASSLPITIIAHLFYHDTTIIISIPSLCEQ